MQLITVNQRFGNSLNSCLQLTLSVQCPALSRCPPEADLGEARADVECAAHQTAVLGPEVQQGLGHLSFTPSLILLEGTVICHKATSSPVLLITVADNLLTYL